ncbi:MAG: YegS/Rv2252/BmrU family lipid kinase [Chthonomonadales bacterium]
MIEKRKACLIVNTRSRRGKEWFKPALDTLKKAENIDLVASHAIKNPKEVIRLTQKAVTDGIPLVIVGGGDGTLSGVAGSFIGSNSVLGVLPLGTGNQFARDLGITADVESACQTITEGIVADVDVGILGDTHFLNVATVGLTTLIANELTVDAKRRLGRLVYLFALVKALQKVRPFRATLTTDEGEQTFETLQVVIGSGRFHGGPFPLAPDASITSGSLVAYALEGTNRWDILRYALKLPGGHHVDMENVQVFHTSGGMLETAPKQRVTVDGETKFHTPIKFGIAAGALSVMVPQEFREQQQELVGQDPEFEGNVLVPA